MAVSVSAAEASILEHPAYDRRLDSLARLCELPQRDSYR